MKHILDSGAVLIGLGLCLLVACRPVGKTPATAVENPPVRPVQLARVETRPMEQVVTTTGTLAAREDSILSAKVPGRLQYLAVDTGSLVRQGDTVAQIEVRDYELRLQQATAALAQARALLGLPLAGDSDDVDLAVVSAVKQALAVLDEAAKNRARVQQLSTSGIASQSELDTVEANHTVALMRYEAACEEARTRMAALAQRRAEYEMARKQLADATITAPFAGAIQTRMANLGEYLSIGTPIVRLVQTDPLRLRLEVAERESLAVRQGQLVRFSLEGNRAAFTGRISRISPAIDDRNRMLSIEADVPNNGSLRPGLFVRAQVVVNESEPGLSVPLNALLVFAGIEKVITVQDSKALEVTVTTGRRGSNWVEIVAGLAADVPVVLDPAGLHSGQPVRVQEPSKALSGLKTAQNAGP